MHPTDHPQGQAPRTPPRYPDIVTRNSPALAPRPARGAGSAAMAALAAALACTPAQAQAQGEAGTLIATDATFGSPMVYAIDPATGRLLAEHPLVGTGALGPTPLSGLAIDPAGRLVGFTPTTDNTFYRIDPDTGEATRVGRLQLSAREGGLATMPDGTLVGASTGSPPRLFTINPDTGRARAGPALDWPADVSGLIARADGTLVALDLADPDKPALLEIDPATGVTRTLAPLAAPAPLRDVGGMALNGDRGFFAVTPDAAENAQLWSFDPVSGDQALVAELVGVGPITGLVALGPPPCPADLDGDGRATFFDFLAFANHFAEGAPAADFNGDGRIDLADFLDFLAALEAGC